MSDASFNTTCFNLSTQQLFTSTYKQNKKNYIIFLAKACVGQKTKTI